MPWILDLKGNFKKEALIEAYDFVVGREQPLRTIVQFNVALGILEQQVLPKSDRRSCWTLVEHTAGSHDDAIHILTEEQEFIFDIKTTPISRMNIVKLSDSRHLVMINAHHVNHDGWSIVNFRRHVLQTYVHVVAGKGQSLDDSDREYDYLAWSLWQQQWMKEGSPEYNRQLEYWKSELDGVGPVELPRDKPLSCSSRTNGGGMVTLSIDAQTVRNWKEGLSKQGCTPFMGGLTLYHILLSRWSNEEDIVTGAATANRNAHPAYSDALGGYTNILSIRSNSSGNPTYAEMLERVRSHILGAWSAQDIPYHKVIAGLGNSNWRGFNVMYAFQESSWHTIDVNTARAGLDANIVYLPKEVTKFDVHLMLRERDDGGLDGDLIYSRSLFEPSTMERFASHFVQLASSVATGNMGEIPIRALSMLSDDEVTKIRDLWNDTTPQPAFPPPQSVVSTIHRSVEMHSANIAVQEASGKTYTYAELAQCQYTIARGLMHCAKDAMSQGCQIRVAMIFNNGIEMYSTLLGILSVGGVCVPIDASHTPVIRIRFLLEDSGADIVVCDKINDDSMSLVSSYDDWGDRRPLFFTYNTVFENGMPATSLDMPVPDCSGSQYAYLLYTSGTTGKPKGCLITHANIHNSIHWWRKLVGLTSLDKSLHFSSYSFVMSLRQIYPTWAVGATLVVPTSPAEFGEAISKCRVTKMALTPSALATLDPELGTSLKVVQVAGEAPTKQLANFWASQLDAFFIGLGPTELCGHACCSRFQVGDSVNIGRPVTNAAVYILNEAGEIQPEGVIGELCVAGENVSAGYLNRVSLTKKHFVNNPFDSRKPRMYKVGDLARRLPGGKIEFIGRGDMQLKIRGFRIETGEIVESILQSSSAINRAEVLYHKSEERGMLVAYVTPSLPEEAIDDIRSHLVRSLPDYMIPARIMSLGVFPLNKNGKLDRGKLPIPSLTETEARIGTETCEVWDDNDPTAKEIMKIWASQLGLEDGAELSSLVHRSFFALGGTSLTAVTTVREINRALDKSVKVTDLIQHDTLVEFTNFLRSKHTTIFEDKKEATDSEYTKRPNNVQHLGHILHPILFALVQTAAVTVLLTVIFLPLGVGVKLFWVLLGRIGFPTILSLLPALYCVVAIVNMLFTRLVITLTGAERSNKDTTYVYPLQSVQFLRWWLVRRMITTTYQLFWFANGSQIMVWVYRALGASIGHGVTIDNLFTDVPHKVRIGNGCSFGFGTRIVCGEIRGDYLVVAPIVIEDRVKTEPRTVITGGAKISKACFVRAWSCATFSLKESECPHIIHGSPAVLADEIDERFEQVPSFTHSLGFAIAQMATMYLLAMLTFCGIGISCK
eukprot:scaffold133765_cov60-Attheya_sp.AAC.3